LPRESRGNGHAWHVHTLAAALILLAAGIGRAAVPDAIHDRDHVPSLPVPADPAKLLGQRIMIGFPGTTASAPVLNAIRRGQVGSVILFAGNIGTKGEVSALTASLQRAARQGRNPPLLISVDQEGGEVKRLQSGPPDLAPPQIDTVTVASSEGRATGRYLHGLGINIDLAPVVDVPTSGSSFIAQQGRAFSSNAGTVAKLATAFALGIQSAGDAATAKHFPGLGTAPIDTDNRLQELHPTAAQRAAALMPYRSLIAHGVDAIMLSVAGFPVYDRSGTVAALSKPIVQGLLRAQLGYDGVTITDALGTPTGHDEITAGALAAQAGADILLYTDSAPGELRALEHALATNRISRADAAASYRRIVALKLRLTGG
jgi:beta-N-acetylhexosaminidase